MDKGVAHSDDWRPIETAPRDQWILLEGEFNGGDTSSARVGRWNPTVFAGLGEYEWQVFNQDAFGPGDDTVAPGDLWNWYSDGRVHGWLPMPCPVQATTALNAHSVGIAAGDAPKNPSSQSKGDEGNPAASQRGGGK